MPEMPEERIDTSPVTALTTQRSELLAATKTLASVASIWPIVPLFFLAILRINRAACAMIALAYVLDAALISVCCPSEIAAVRYQGIWLISDTALAATLITALVQLAYQHGLPLWSRIAGRATSENFGKLTTRPL